jgi:hypothetical protein
MQITALYKIFSFFSPSILSSTPCSKMLSM